MSRRRDALERALDREAERLERQYLTGVISRHEYEEVQRELEREAREETRAAMKADMEDVRDDWRW